MSSRDLGCWIDAAFDLRGWEDALDHTARELGLRCVGLVWGDSGAPVTSVSAQSPAWFADACVDVLRDRHATRSGERTLEEGWTLTWQRSLGGGPCCAALFALGERPVDRTAFEATALVVRSAVTARARVLDMASASALKAAALDQSPWGAAIVDAELRVDEMNESCASILRRSDGFKLVQGRIVCRAREDQTALSQAVAGTLRAPCANGGAVVRVSRPDGAQPYVMRPLGQRGSAISSKCLLLVLDPDEEARPAQEIWRAMFDLTNCEMVIAEGLVSGRKAHDIARQRGVSVQTVRSQIKRLFERLNVTSQTQAAVLLSRVAPFRRPVPHRLAPEPGPGDERLLATAR